MNLIRLTAVLLLLVMYCAERTNSIFDPDNKSGDYGFEYTIDTLSQSKLANGQLSVFVRYPLKCQREVGKDQPIGYRYRFDPVNNSAGVQSLVNDTGFGVTSWLYFTGPYSGQITVTALKPNGDVISHTDSILVGNPFRIKTVTGWMKREGNIGLAVIGRIDSVPKELETDKFLVQWLRNGVASDTGNIAETCTLGVQDTSTLSAIIYEKDNSKVSLPLDSIIVTTQNDGAPQVRLTELAADNIKNVRVNEPDTIRVAVNFADSIVWVYNGINRTGTSAHYVFTPADTARIDTLIVFVKNRFGICSDTDTVLIKAGNYAIMLKAPQASFPLSIAGRAWYTWSVEAEAADIPSGSIRYHWTVSPKSAVDSIRDTTTAAMRLYCNPNRDVDSFTVGVYAYKDTARSLEISKLVFVHRYRPVLRLTASTDSCYLKDTAKFTFTVFDTAGSVKSIWYRSEFDGDSVRPLHDTSLALVADSAGKKIVKFWCVDTRGYVSDTLRDTVNVRSNDCYFYRTDTVITAYAGDPVRISAPGAYPGNNSIIKTWMWDVDTSGSFDKNTNVGFFDTTFSTPGTRIMRVGCENNKGKRSVKDAMITITVDDGLPTVDSVYIAKSSVFIRDKVKLRIMAFDGNGSVQKLVVLWKESDTAATISVAPPPKKIVDTTIDIAMNSVDTIQFSVVAIDDESNPSQVFARIDPIVVLAGRPVADSVTSDSCWINKNTSFTIKAHDAPGDSDVIDSVAIQWDSGDVWQGYDSLLLSHLYTSFGKKQIRLVVFDATGMASDTLNDSVFVNQGPPTASVWVDSAATWIKDEIHCVVHGSDPHGSIAARFIRWDSTESFVNLPDSTEKHSYTKAGVHTVSAYVVDNDGISSDTVSINVKVRLGQPSVSISGNTVSWVNDPVTVTVSASDSNSNTVARYIRWDNDSSYFPFSDSIGTHIYLKDSVHTVSVYSVDDDEISSDTMKLNIRVRKGAPLITSIVTNPAINSIYINDNIGFRVTVLDSNDLHDSIRVSWLGTTSYTEAKMIAVNDTISFSHLFARDRAGSVSVRFAVTDTDQFTDDTILTLQVQAGAPVVSLRNIVPVPDSICVNDTVKFRFRAADGNGQVRKVYVNWQGGNTPTDSLIYSPGAAVIDSAFSHVYDTTGSGTKHVRIWAVDEDTIQSTVLDSGILVHKYPPRLWGDTLWVVVNKDYGDYYYKPQHEDTNGVIDTFYFGLTGNRTQAVAKYRIDSAAIQIDGATIHNGNIVRYIWGKDDDGFVSGGAFRVYADSAPPKPTIVYAGGSGSPVNIAWSGKDTKDGNQTLYSILLRKGIDPPGAGDTLVTFRAGSTFDSGSAFSNDFKYTFTPTGGTGTYSYRVIARDARGTRSESDNGTLLY